MTLGEGRGSSGALALGIAQAAVDASITYAKQREAFRPAHWKISNDPVHFWPTWVTQVACCAPLLLYHAAYLKDHQ